MNLTPDQEEELKGMMQLYKEWNSIPGLITWMVILAGTVSGLVALVLVLLLTD